jgi:hypothetical protein
MKMPRLLLGVLLLLYPSLARAQSGNVPPPPADRVHDFVYASILSPGPYVLDLGAAIIDDVSKFPSEWEDTDHAFGKRFAARVASGFASDVIGHTTGALLHHRVLYEPCGCSAGWARTRHAIGRGFVTRHDSGRVVFHVSIFVAKFAAAGLATTWYPDSYTSSDIVREGFAGVGANAGLNILREFGPDLMRLFGLR